MANNIFWGKIYEFTNWGKGIVNNISWGKIYADLVGALPSFALNFANIATDFTFTRSSFATRVNEQGLIETVTDLGSELITNGDFATDSDWSFGSGWSIEDGKAIALNTNGNLEQFVSSVTASKLYIITFDYVYTSGDVVLYAFGNNLGNLTETKSYSFTTTATGSTTKLQFYGVGTNLNATIDNISVQEVFEDDVPRIDYTNGEAEFLLEPQSTNLLPYSEDFSNSNWVKSGDTTVEVGYLAPDGTLSAYKVSGTSSALQYNSITNTTDTRTIYARTVSGTATANLCSFNQDTNNLFTITEEWQRFEVNGAISTGGTTFYAVDFRGTTTLNEIILWGAQVEALSYATSYIPTNGSAVTRSNETCVEATPTINSEEGVLYIEASALIDGDVVRQMSISDGGTENYVSLRYSNNAGRFQAFLRSNNGSADTLSRVGIPQTDLHKIAVRWDATTFDMWIDGAMVSNTTTTATPIGLNTFGFDSFRGRTKDLKIYTEALTDSQLEELTTI